MNNGQVLVLIECPLFQWSSGILMSFNYQIGISGERRTANSGVQPQQWGRSWEKREVSFNRPQSLSKEKSKQSPSPRANTPQLHKSQERDPNLRRDLKEKSYHPKLGKVTLCRPICVIHCTWLTLSALNTKLGWWKTSSG